MPSAEPKFQEPTIGRIVIYTSKMGVDMPAIVTGLPPADEDGVQRSVFLAMFPPPGHGVEHIDRVWGVPHARGVGPEWFVGRWRWPERP